MGHVTLMTSIIMVHPVEGMWKPRLKDEEGKWGGGGEAGTQNHRHNL